MSKIWVDADACPVVIKDILFRAAIRTETPLTLVANRTIAVPVSRHIASIQVPSGFDRADQAIVERAQPGDLVITGDIPLADQLLSQGCSALSPKGELFTRDTIKARLGMRDFLETLRSSGIHTGGPAPFSQQDRKAFADRLDTWLARNRPTKAVT